MAYIKSSIRLNDIILKSFILLLTYWILMIFIGHLIANHTYIYVSSIDPEKITTSSIATGASLLLFIMGAFTWITLTNKKNNPPLTHPRPFNLRFHALSISLTLCAAIFFTTFNAVGYIPLLNHTPGSKYFAEAQDIYITYRPYYTFAINLATASLTACLAFFVISKKPYERILLLTLISAFTVLLALTAKRGPLLLPFAYLLFGLFLIGRIRLVYLITFFSLFIFAAGIMHSTYIQYDNERNILLSLANSLFVGVRELARVFSNFNGDHTYGLTYIAGLTSFLPTSINELKEAFLYPRYLILMEGGNPDLSGGPRGLFIGEAYINFGAPGIVVISWLFGASYVYFFKIIRRIKVFSHHEIMTGVISAFIFQQGILAFFENGSAFIFHFASKLIFIYALCYFSIKWLPHTPGHEQHTTHLSTHPRKVTS